MTVLGQKINIQMPQTLFKPQILLENNFCGYDIVYSSYLNISNEIASLLGYLTTIQIKPD